MGIKVHKHPVIWATIIVLSCLFVLSTSVIAEPIITNIQTINITHTSATVTWNTNENANSAVRYGNTTSLGNVASNNTFTTSHSISLSGLISNTVYYYQVESTNIANSTAIDNNGGLFYTFTTNIQPDTTPPIITNIQALNITSTSTTITWTTNENADSVVRYGNTTALGSIESDSNLSTTHSVPLNSLVSNTTYYFQVESTDESLNTSVDNNSSLFYTFITTTQADSIPPIINTISVGNITVSSAVVAWTTNEIATSIVNYGNTTSLNQVVSNNILTLDHLITLTNLQAGTTYFYEIQSTDAANHTAIDNNNNNYYTFSTPIQLTMTGWGWCTDYKEIRDIQLISQWTFTQRNSVPEVSDIHMTGILTITTSNATAEIIPLDMYGTKIRSIFYISQQEPGQSATLGGLWLSWTNGQYVSTLGELILPDGEMFKTGRFYVLQLDTPGVEIQGREPGNFVSNIEYLLTSFAKFSNSLLDELMLTDFSIILGAILTKLMVLLSAIRDLGILYIP